MEISIDIYNKYVIFWLSCYDTLASLKILHKPQSV